MAQNATTTVQITFQTPQRVNLPRSASVHERRLEGVPASTAQQMAQDYAAYQAEPSVAEQRKLYTYQRMEDDGGGNDEAFIALDFGEIVSLQPGEEAADHVAETDQALV